MRTTFVEPPACEAFFHRVPRNVSPIERAGFSGSTVCIVEADEGPEACGAWVVKAFPPTASAEHAEFVHRLMRHLRAAGLAIVATPRPPAVFRAGGCEQVGESLVRDADGRLWEAIRFLPGRPLEDPTQGHVAAAMKALAELHTAAAKLPGGPVRRLPSRGVAERSRRAAAVLARPWSDRLRSERFGGDDRIGELLASAVSCMRHGGAAAVRTVAGWSVPPIGCQAVLRDIWHDHVLFEDGRVSGLVDFHSVGFDTVATDLARLVGSWRAAAAARRPEASGDRRLPAWLSWEPCLEEYASIRPLCPRERSLVPLLHHAGVIIGIDNWIRWIVEERRAFADRAGVERRLEQLVACLPEAIDVLAGRGSGRDGPSS